MPVMPKTDTNERGIIALARAAHEAWYARQFYLSNPALLGWDGPWEHLHKDAKQEKTKQVKEFIAAQRWPGDNDSVHAAFVRRFVMMNGWILE